MIISIEAEANLNPVTNTLPLHGITSVIDQEYHESLPTVKSWFKKRIYDPKQQIRDYFLSLFPCLTWIYRYNLTWFLGDLIAGFTIGTILVPESMAYARLANLAPQFGLYSSLVGVMIYWLFGTSKDISVGPVAVMSVLTGNILDSIQETYPQYEPYIMASALALMTGCIIFTLGIFQLGFIIDFIPSPALEAFMTGSAINIAMRQIPVMMGNKEFFDTRKATYLVFINFWKNIKYCDLNAALGLTALFLLFSIRFICIRGSKRYPNREKLFFFISSLRSVFVILLYLLISWLINRHDKIHPRTTILGTIPRGLQNMGVPYIDQNVFSAIIPHLPATVIILLIEHISIAKSFGRINNYIIDSNQEFIAIGITNIFSPFFGGYPATGSFSRTAIKSKAGVRTPLAGVVTGSVIILSIYVLPSVFYWISEASLAAVIIHAISHLIVKPQILKQYWQVNPIEFFIFWAGVIVIIFTEIEYGIYTAIILSVVLLLYRITKAHGQLVGRVQIQQIIKESNNDNYIYSGVRNIYIPLDHSDGSNPVIIPFSPANGIFIYRIHESFLYPNAAYYTEKMVEQIFRETKPGKTNPYGDIGHQPWNLKTSRHPENNLQQDDTRPILHAIILDFTGVPHLDVTGLQTLVNVRQQLDRYTDWNVNWHFVGLCNPWINRALISAGFGSSDQDHRVFSVANIRTDPDRDNDNTKNNVTIDNYSQGNYSSNRNMTFVPILDTDRSLFHVDLDEAYKVAVLNFSQRMKSVDSNSNVL